jgi:cytoskeletal protein RodZ
VELEHFGNWLRSRREARGLSLAELSRATKIKERLLELLELGKADALPAPVFVRGFVSAYARAVGADEKEALERLGPAGHTVLETAPLPPKVFVEVDDQPEPGSGAPRRLGVVMVVLLILVVATLTLSLLLRHGAAPGGGIS